MLRFYLNMHTDILAVCWRYRIEMLFAFIQWQLSVSCFVYWAFSLLLSK